MLGPLSPALIRISPSASDPCSRTCVVTLWCKLQSASSNRDCSLLTHAPLFMVHRRKYSYVNDSASIAPVSIYDRLRAQTKFVTLANINSLIAVFHLAPMARRGCVGSYQLSVFGFQIVAVFGRIRIVHLAHYSVRFEFESNIRYSPIRNGVR